MGSSVAELLDTELWCLGDDELLENLKEIETLSRQLHAASLKTIAEAEHRGLYAKHCYRDLAALLRDTLRIASQESKRRVEHALALHGEQAMNGTSLAPALPLVAKVADTGVLDPAHIDAIWHTDQAMPAWASENDRVEAEETLVEAARTFQPSVIRQLGKRIIAYLDQDGVPPNEAELANPINELRYTVKRNGRVVFTGELEPEAGELLKVVLSPLAKPRPLDGQPDIRSTAERQGDAFAEVLRRTADTGDLPDDGGAKPHVVVTMTLDQLRDGLGSALLGDSGAITASQARALACDANIIPAVLGSKSEILDIGRSARTIPTAMRRALVLRDKGCAFPDCDRPPPWCDSHHIRYWSDGGETKLDNLILLCRRHHRHIHHTQWSVRIRDGIPEFIPPKCVDVERKPRVNLLRQPVVT